MLVILVHNLRSDSLVLTSTPLLVIILLAQRLHLNHQPIPSFSPRLPFVIPFIPNKCLPRPNNLFLLPAAFHGFFYGDVYPHRLERVVAAVYGSEVASCGDIVEVEGVGAGDVGV